MRTWRERERYETFSEFVVRFYWTEINDGTADNPERASIGGLIIIMMIPLFNLIAIGVIINRYFECRKKVI